MSQAEGPEPIGDILGRLFTARGWGRRQDRLRLEQAWEAAAGAAAARQTRVNGLRRGVLEVEVGNAVLLQELSAFQRRSLLAKLRQELPGVSIADLRFKAGVMNGR